MKHGTMIVKNSLRCLLLALGILGQVSCTAQAKELEDGAWYGTLEAGATKLPLVVTVTKSEAGNYGGNLKARARERAFRWIRFPFAVMR